MKLNNLTKTQRLLAVGVVTLSTLSIAEEAKSLGISVFTQTQNLESTLTPFGSTGATPNIDPFIFPLYDPANFDGQELHTVIISCSANATTDLTFSTTTTSEVGGSAGATIGCFPDNTPGIFLNPNPVASFGADPVGFGLPGAIIVDQTNTPLTLADLSGFDEDMITIEKGEAGFDGFIGSGNFLVDLVGNASSSIDAVGGNVTTEQITLADIEFTIEYFAKQEEVEESVPEPASILGLLAVGGAGLVTRRRKS
ncbi:MAG: PEP-CTERM sorting domain-containing protein [Crocosphaera sp.]|nr:PEP-CTERM sorting domain-containing protein [Crocosphaera sp.]